MVGRRTAKIAKVFPLESFAVYSNNVFLVTYYVQICDPACMGKLGLCTQNTICKLYEMDDEKFVRLLCLHKKFLKSKNAGKFYVPIFSCQVA